MDFSDVRFEQGSFDLIFSRLLVLALSDWRAYIERCVAFAKPDVSEHSFIGMDYTFGRAGLKCRTSLMKHITFPLIFPM